MSVFKWIANLFKSKDEPKVAKTVELQNGRKAKLDERGNFIGWAE